MEISIIGTKLRTSRFDGIISEIELSDIVKISNDVESRLVRVNYEALTVNRVLVLDYSEITNETFASSTELYNWLITNTSLPTTQEVVEDIEDVKDETDKIDSATTLGLAGTNNSLAYRVHEIEKHFHNNEKWFGKSADQSGVNKWAKSVSESGMPTSFRAISGTANYGTDVNDEALVWGLYDTMGTDAKLDLHQIFVTAASTTTLWIVRIIYGAGTMADAITAGQFTEIPIIADAAQNGSIDVILKLMMPRITIGTHKIWIQAKNATNNATIDFIIGGHSYVA